MNNKPSKLKAVPLLTTLILLTPNIQAAEGDENTNLRRIDDSALRELIQQSTTPAERLADLPLVEIVDDIVEDKRSDDEVLSIIHDSFTPVNRTIFLDPEDPSEIPIIKTSKSRDSIIPFFKQGMEPLKITGVFIKNSPISSEAGAASRFEATQLEEITNGNVMRFSTNVLTGWNTVQLSFEGYDQLMALKIVAGDEYDLSSKGVLLSNSFTPQSSKQNQKASTHKGISEYTNNSSTIKKALIEFANSGITPNVNDKEYRLEIFQVPSGILPSAIAYKSKVNGVEYILLRSNGILVEPDYSLSQPAKTINENIYAYAIPISEAGSFISIEYQEKRFIYQLARRGISDATQY